jgi:hypothetical protein
MNELDLLIFTYRLRIENATESEKADLMAELKLLAEVLKAKIGINSSSQQSA